MEEIILGTEAKIRLVINPINGKSPYELQDWKVELYTNSKKKVIVSKKDCSAIENDTNAFYVPFDSAEVGVGDLNADVVVYVPDLAFKDRLRTEIARIESIATIIP